MLYVFEIHISTVKHNCNLFPSFISLSVDSSPVITCPASQIFTLRPGQSINFPGAIATDDSGITPMITYSTPTPGVLLLGSDTTVLATGIQQDSIIEVTATASDNNNNQASCTFNLDVNGKNI